MNLRKDKPEFLERLNKVRPKLKRGYADRLLSKYPTLSRTKIYAVKRGASCDWQILELFESLPE